MAQDGTKSLSFGIADVDVATGKDGCTVIDDGASGSGAAEGAMGNPCVPYRATRFRLLLS